MHASGPFNPKPELLIISELVAKHATLQHQRIRGQKKKSIHEGLERGKVPNLSKNAY
jgi:hypothetical protein